VKEGRKKVCCGVIKCGFWLSLSCSTPGFSAGGGGGMSRIENTFQHREEEQQKEESLESDNNMKFMGMSFCKDDEDVMMGGRRDLSLPPSLQSHHQTK
jgi:hypothetical protein